MTKIAFEWASSHKLLISQLSSYKAVKPRNWKIFWNHSNVFHILIVTFGQYRGYPATRIRLTKERDDGGSWYQSVEMVSNI